MKYFVPVTSCRCPLNGLVLILCWKRTGVSTSTLEVPIVSINHVLYPNPLHAIIRLHQHLSFTKYTSYLYPPRRLVHPIFPLLAPVKAKLLSFTQLLEKFPPYQPSSAKTIRVFTYCLLSHISPHDSSSGQLNFRLRLLRPRDKDHFAARLLAFNSAPACLVSTSSRRYRHVQTNPPPSQCPGQTESRKCRDTFSALADWLLSQGLPLLRGPP